LNSVLPQLRPRYGFKRLLVRGDSAFDQQQVREACRRHGAHFALVGKELGERPRLAGAVAEDAWVDFVSSTHLRESERRKHCLGRTRGLDQRKLQACRRRYGAKRKLQIQVTEVPYRPAGAETTCRLVILRELLEERTFDGQMFLLYERYQYRYIITDLPMDISTAEVVDLTYDRCDQENIIEQLKNGMAGWLAPVRESYGNAAFLLIARLAWNLAKAIAILGLPPEAVRWELKRFRRAVVVIAAAVTRRSRQPWIRISTPGRFAAHFEQAFARICT